jgi:pimeloyl-ACP methyl ester carboxylesterase
MGGYVALHLALEQPDRVEKVATLGTKFRWDPQTAARVAAHLDPDTIRAKVTRFADALASPEAPEAGSRLARCGFSAISVIMLLADATLARITHPCS